MTVQNLPKWIKQHFLSRKTPKKTDCQSLKKFWFFTAQMNGTKSEEAKAWATLRIKPKISTTLSLGPPFWIFPIIQWNKRMRRLGATAGLEYWKRACRLARFVDWQRLTTWLLVLRLPCHWLSRFHARSVWERYFHTPNNFPPFCFDLREDIFSQVKEPVICPNQHVFCSTCMEVWLRSNPACPTCRTEITPDRPCKKILGKATSSHLSFIICDTTK